MNGLKQILSMLVFCIVLVQLYAQPTPPNGKKWEKVEALSDEFNGNSLNTSKWAVNVSTWIGRPPGIFKQNAVKVKDGKLQFTAYKLSSPETVNGNVYTHAGALVRSLKNQTYGYYECRMKANKTFMSSTFWLINKRNEGSDCDVRVTELDITETVGVNSNGANWVNTTINSMNSNTHSRGTTCNNTPVGQEGGKASLGEPSWKGYHTYGAWWKNKDEVLFYLDGKFVYKIKPPANFNLPMYLRLVTETYDWNPPKAGQDGMNDSVDNRTTYYDWVRTYKLVDDIGIGTVDEVSFKNAPTTINPKTSYTFDIDYEASTDREIVVEFWSSTNWITQQKETVSKGRGTKSITVTLPSPPAPGSGYVYKVHIRPIGTSWQQALDRDQINNVTIEEVVSLEDKVSFKNAPATINPQSSYTFNMEYSASTDREIVVSFWKNNTWIASKVERVSKGTGAKAVKVTLPSPPSLGSGYSYKSHIRPIGTNWQQALDTDRFNNVTVVSANPQLIANGTYFIMSSQNTQRLLARALESHGARMHDVGNYDDQRWIFNHLGDNVYTIKNKGTNRYLEVPNAQCGNGKNVATWTNANDTHKKWKVVSNGNGIYGLKPMHCLNAGLDRAAGAINANVQIWEYNSSNENQKWKIAPAGNNRLFNQSESIIGLYPNPAKDYVTIIGHEPGEEIIIYNLLGVVVKTTVAKSDKEIIYTSDFEAGIYIVSINKKSKLQLIKE
ncbi:RICIN domain-containing protein [Aquimarina gracilis]|uniref:RICIN domain-containing protein n=1 Tax=Aquimarina gracilis TaxID=874422 RepID=A0ABU5ZT83_9FLAO|nr:RICIN domain-containing protein [Aquimarina gracilis]MEB3345184.1 RICIN domain-containing protein [Aquimarina gracilis]